MPRAANPTLREDILQAALRIVEEKGAVGLTMRAVAGLLGYSATAIYQHFTGKEELLLTLKLQAGDLLTTEMELARAESTLEEQLFQMGRRYIHFGLQNPTFYQLMFQDMGLETMGTPPQRERLRQSWTVMRATLKTWVEERGFQGIDIDKEANVLWIMVHGLTSLALAGRLASAQTDEVFALFDLSGSRWMKGLLSTQTQPLQERSQPKRGPTRTAPRTTMKTSRPRANRRETK